VAGFFVQVPRYRRHSHSDKSVAEALSTTVYAVPKAFANPCLASGFFTDFLIRSRFRLVPKDVRVLSSSDLCALTSPPDSAQTPRSAHIQANGAASATPAESQVIAAAYSGQKEMKATHE